jgi:hypothetical protein
MAGILITTNLYMFKFTMYFFANTNSIQIFGEF